MSRDRHAPEKERESEKENPGGSVIIIGSVGNAREASMMNPITKEQAEHLAALVHGIREDWDDRGIVAALAKVRDRPLGRVIVAAVLAADDPACRTPAVIALDGPHWTHAAARTCSEIDRHPATVAYAAACATCGRDEHGCRTARRAGDDHRFRSRAEVHRQTALDRAHTERRARAAPGEDGASGWSPARPPYLSPQLRAQLRAELAAGRERFAARQATPAATTTSSTDVRESA